MGVDDREWYREERRRKERLHYDPKSFRRSRADDGVQPPRGRPGFATFTAIVLVLALAAAPTVGRWLERLASTSSGDTIRPASAKPG
jgi:hypothetical protein